MKTKLLFATPIWLAANATRMSHDTHHLSDTDLSYLEGNCPVATGPKDRHLVKKIGVTYMHESILEMLDYTFDVEMNTKTLMSFSRHRIGISLTITSSRYTPTKNRNSLRTQGTPNTEKYLSRIMDIVQEAIDEGLEDDEISLLLPQGFIYRGQIKLNARSLRHFFTIRMTKGAHVHSRDLAYRLFDNLPNSHKYLFTDKIQKSNSRYEEYNKPKEQNEKI